jgi:hypothetical protein
MHDLPVLLHVDGTVVVVVVVVVIVVIVVGIVVRLIASVVVGRAAHVSVLGLE